MNDFLFPESNPERGCFFDAGRCPSSGLSYFAPAGLGAPCKHLLDRAPPCLNICRPCGALGHQVSISWTRLRPVLTYVAPAGLGHQVSISWTRLRPVLTYVAPAGLESPCKHLLDRALHCLKIYRPCGAWGTM